MEVAPQMIEQEQPVSVETKQPDVEQPQQSQQGQQDNPDDFVARVSKFVENNDTRSKTDDQINSDYFNDKDLLSKIEAINDPDLKNQMGLLRKSMMRGANEKFQEIAEIRKELQTIKQDNGQWTPERVRSLMNRSDFIQAAQEVANNSQENANDPLEYVDDGVKSYIKKLESQIEGMRNDHKTFFEKQNQALRQQQHQTLQEKYGNYSPQEIDTITFDMLKGKIQATPEHIYKAFKHDENVKKAYEMGRRDERDGVSEKKSSLAAQGIMTSHETNAIVPEKDESTQSFFNRVIQKNLKLAKNKGLIE